MNYRFHEGSLTIPDDWRDESMNIFKTSEAEGYNLVISRERIPRSLDPQQHLAGQRKVIEDNLAGYREMDRATIDAARTHWPFLRDRRIDAYGDLTRRFLDHD